MKKEKKDVKNGKKSQKEEQEESGSESDAEEGEDGSKKTGDKEDGKKMKKKIQPKTLEVTLFDRLLSMYGGKVKRLLNVQYRMNEKVRWLYSAFPWYQMKPANLQLPCDLDHAIPFQDTL